MNGGFAVQLYELGKVMSLPCHCASVFQVCGVDLRVCIQMFPVCGWKARTNEIGILFKSKFYDN